MLTVSDINGIFGVLNYQIKDQSTLSKEVRKEVISSMQGHLAALKEIGRLTSNEHLLLMQWMFNFVDPTDPEEFQALRILILNNTNPFTEEPLFFSSAADLQNPEAISAHYAKLFNYYANNDKHDQFIKTLLPNFIINASILGPLLKELHPKYAESLYLEMHRLGAYPEIIKYYEESRVPAGKNDSPVLNFYLQAPAHERNPKFLNLCSSIESIIIKMRHPFDQDPSLINEHFKSFQGIFEETSKLTPIEAQFVLDKYGKEMLETHCAGFFYALNKIDPKIVSGFIDKLPKEQKVVLEAFLSFSSQEVAAHDALVEKFASGGRLSFDEGLLYSCMLNETSKNHSFTPIFVRQCNGKSKMGIAGWTEDDVLALMKKLNENPEMLPEGEHITFIFPGDHWLTGSVSRIKNKIDFTVFNSTTSGTLEIEDLSFQLNKLQNLRQITSFDKRLNAYLGCSYFALHDAKLIARVESLLGTTVSAYVSRMPKQGDGSSVTMEHYPYIFQQYKQSQRLLKDDYERARDNGDPSFNPHDPHPRTRFLTTIGLDGKARLANTSLEKNISTMRKDISRFLRAHPEFLHPETGKAALTQHLTAYHKHNIARVEALVESPSQHVSLNL